MVAATANEPVPSVSIHTESSELEADVAGTSVPEDDLVRRAQDGDVGAFSQLVRRYQRRAVSVAYRLLNNTEDASDVSQDAFVRAFRHLGQLGDPSRFGPWLMRIVSNLSLNFRRARGTRAAASLDEPIGDSGEDRLGFVGERFMALEGDERGAAPAELSDAISKAVATLPEKQRLALVLFSVEGMPQKDVAEILECSIELVKWNVFQARKKLKDLLAEFL